VIRALVGFIGGEDEEPGVTALAAPSRYLAAAGRYEVSHSEVRSGDAGNAELAGVLAPTTGRAQSRNAGRREVHPQADPA
jgi:hypothetical protein